MRGTAVSGQRRRPEFIEGSAVRSGRPPDVACWIRGVVLCAAMWGAAFAQGKVATPRTGSAAAVSDTSRAVAGDSTVARQSLPDSLSSRQSNTTDSAAAVLSNADSLRAGADSAGFVARSADTSRVRSPLPSAKKEPTRKIKLIKHDFNFREQVIMAACMMFFVLLMFNTTQALNPD